MRADFDVELTNTNPNGASTVIAEPDFQTFFQHSVATTLSRILGESAAKSILYHTGFSRAFESPVEFHAGLVKMLGEEGAQTLEKSIIKGAFAELFAPAPRCETREDFVKAVEFALDIYSGRMVQRAQREPAYKMSL